MAKRIIAIIILVVIIAAAVVLFVFRGQLWPKKEATLINLMQNMNAQAKTGINDVTTRSVLASLQSGIELWHDANGNKYPVGVATLEKNLPVNTWTTEARKYVTDLDDLLAHLGTGQTIEYSGNATTYILSSQITSGTWLALRAGHGVVESQTKPTL